MAKFFGYNFPFFSENSVLPPQADLRLIKNDVKQLLLTSPGERVMRPDYGTIIRKTPFEPLDGHTLLRITASIKKAINRFEPRVIINDIKFVTKPDNNYMEIIVLMSLSNDPSITLDVSINTRTGNSQSI